MSKPVEEMSASELRVEAARLIRQRAMIRRLYDDTTDPLKAIQARLLNEDGVKMRKAEGLPTSHGTLTVLEERKGRAWPNEDEIDKDAGELPEELRPVKDKRVVIEHLSELSTGIQAELIGLAGWVDGEPPEDERERPVQMKVKAKYPTVAKLRGEFGPDTKYVGVPPLTRQLVLIVDPDSENPTTLGADGILS